MKNAVKNPQSQIEKPNLKTKRAEIQKEYYILRDDVFEFIGIFTSKTMPELHMMDTAEA